MKDLDVQPGDRVVIKGGHGGPFLGTVDRLTKTRIYIVGRQGWFRHDGWEPGGGVYSRRWIGHPTAVEVEEIRRRQLATVIRDVINSEEQLAEIPLARLIEAASTLMGGEAE